MADPNHDEDDDFMEPDNNQEMQINDDLALELVVVEDEVLNDVQNDDSSDDEDNENVDDDGEVNDETGDEELPEAEAFDMEIPVQHRYLGEAQEVSGRTIFDENVIHDLPIISKSGIILMPGQTIPITFFHPTVIGMMKRILETTKTFGLIQHRHLLSGEEGHLMKVVVGTTAEIYEFYEPSADSLEIGFKIKAKGRQRFKVISSRTQVDGNVVASVRILEEIELSDFEHEFRLLSRDRLRVAPVADDRLDEGDHQRKRRAKASVDYAALTPWPRWVYEMYNGQCLVQRVHKQMQSLKLFTQGEKVKIPHDPKELSFWIAVNFPLDDAHRLAILEINCAIQRLRFELSLLEKYQILCCRYCGEEVARQEDIFSMSTEGPQGAYVNPGGVVHETLTLEKAQNLTLIGRSSTEYSWFPGYSWTICQCQVCERHMGWKFKATIKKLKPQKFFGLSRRSLKPKIEILPSMNAQDQIRPLL